MKKKLNGKLSLNRETLRMLEEKGLDQAQGGGTTTTAGSGLTDTCASCVGCQVTERLSYCYC